MVRIVSDTSTLYSSAQAQAAGFDVSPLSVTINSQSYREFDEISSADFVNIIRQGHLPVSSQPAIGQVVDVYEKYPDDQILNITMADGLSGTYKSAVAAAEMVEHRDNITVLNTRSLCGPHRHMVEKAVQWAKDGLSVQQIVQRLEVMMDSAKSFLIPADFDYLRRGGRLSPLVSYVGKAVNLSPVMTQTDDGCHLTIAGIRRGMLHGFRYVLDVMRKTGVGAGWKVYVVHADAMDMAKKTLDLLKNAIPDAVYEIHPLSPAFITQGGPGCVAVQYVRE